MKKYFQILIICIIFGASAQAQLSDYIPGTSIIFEDHFDHDPAGDFPAKWSTSFDGQIVVLDNIAGKWLKISQPTSVNPELKKILPEDCTIEFDLFLKNTPGVAPVIKFGLTPLNDVATGDVNKKSIYVQLTGYNETGSIVFGKNAQDLGTKGFSTAGYIGRLLHVSLAINKTRFRVYFDQQKVVDMPKLLTPDYRNNFFIASPAIVPSSEEAVYISNIKIAAAEADARSVLIKQLNEKDMVAKVDPVLSSPIASVIEEPKAAPPVIPNQVLPQTHDTIAQVIHADTLAIIRENVPVETVVKPVSVDTVHLAPDTAILFKENIPVVKDSTITEPAVGTQTTEKGIMKVLGDQVKSELVNTIKETKDKLILDLNEKADKALKKNKTLTGLKKLVGQVIKL